MFTPKTATPKSEKQQGESKLARLAITSLSGFHCRCEICLGSAYIDDMSIRTLFPHID